MQETLNKFDKTIYKKDSKGKVRFLHVYNDGADLVQESGVLGTDSPVVHRSTAKAKNVGKANETTPEMQAMLEAEAKVGTKMSTGYFDTIAEAEEKGGDSMMLPMLAKDGKKMLDKIVYPCYVQPKLDGMRALYHKSTMTSRKGKVIETMSHIIEDVANSTHAILDGELYAHGLSFQENMKLIKKDRGDATKEVKFHVYDLISDEPFGDRYCKLCKTVEDYAQVEVVATYLIENEEQLKYYHQIFIGQGYEGTIIRHTNEGYAVNKRANQLLKYKDFIDEAYEIVDVLPSDKNPLHGVVHCKNEEGTFGCGMKFSHAEREHILANKESYIGQIAEVRFFEFTDDGVPRFPVCYGFRDDK